MQEFYRAVSQCDPEKKHMTAVALDGPAFGQRALFTDGCLVWQSERDGIFTDLGSRLWEESQKKKEGQKGLVEIGGIRVFCDRLG